jgi:hypothetical protein
MPQATWICKIASGKAKTFTTHWVTPLSKPCKFMGEMQLIKVGTLVLMEIFWLKCAVAPKGGMPQATWFCKIAWGKAETLHTDCISPEIKACKFMGEMQLIKVGTLVLMVKFWLKCTVAPQRWYATGYMVLQNCMGQGLNVAHTLRNTG